MKKILLTLLLLVAIIFTTSCSHTPASTQPTDTKAPEAPEETPTVESPATNEITWDESKYEVMLFSQPTVGKKNEFEYFPDYVGCKNDSHYAVEPVPDMTVEVLGESYTGKFSEPYCQWFCSLQQYSYKSLMGENSRDFGFSVDNTGKLKRFTFYDFYNMIDDTAPKLSSTEALAKAKEYVEQLTEIKLANSSYKAEAPIYELAMGRFPQYRILFVSYVGGIKTANRIEITIDESGKFISYYNVDNSNFDGIDTSFIDMDEINSIFDDAIEYIYGGLRERFQISGFEREAPILAAHPDGTLIFTSHYSFHMLPKDADETTLAIATESNSMTIIIRNNK